MKNNLANALFDEQSDVKRLLIADVEAWAVSYPLPLDAQVTLGVGKTIKRDAVVVRVRTRDGIVGWGEAHHGRAHSVIAAMVNDCLADLLAGEDAADVVGLWQKMVRAQVLTQGSGTAALLAISGIDMALWDIRAKAVGWPLYRLLGGAARPVPAYAGGIALGWDAPEANAQEAQHFVKLGYRAMKLRIGQGVDADVTRLRAVREAVGDDVALMCDVNSLYSLGDVRRIMPVLEELNLRWFEEPFMPQEDRQYKEAKSMGRTPLAAGENLFTRQEFGRLVAMGNVTIIQPDLSKVGGFTEGLRIAAMVLGAGLELHPHASMTGINAAASLHFLSAIEGGGYLEADASKLNPLRDELVTGAPRITADGTMRATDTPGLGIEVNEDFIRAHPPILGSAYRRD